MRRAPTAAPVSPPWFCASCVPLATQPNPSPPISDCGRLLLAEHGGPVRSIALSAPPFFCPLLHSSCGTLRLLCRCPPPPSQAPAAVLAGCPLFDLFHSIAPPVHFSHARLLCWATVFYAQSPFQARFFIVWRAPYRPPICKTCSYLQDLLGCHPSVQPLHVAVSFDTTICKQATSTQPIQGGHSACLWRTGLPHWHALLWFVGGCSCATASPRTVCLCSVCLEGERAAGCCRSPVLNWRKVALGRPCTQCVARDKWFVRMMHAQVTMVGAGRQSSALCP